MTHIPDVLWFKINRLTFDKATLQPEKVNDVFDFKKRIFPDRFIFKNMKVA